MAGFALRFAHASNLQIDAPLSGVGTPPETARRIAEDAPATAWQRVVDACIDRGVDFLLLTPRTCAGDLSPFDFRVLLSGLDRLDEHKIPVYWTLAVGEALSEAMRDELPDNVRLLTGPTETAALMHEGRIVVAFDRSESSPSLRINDRLTPPTTVPTALRIRIAATAHAIDAVPDSGSDAPHFRDAPASGDYIACWGRTGAQSCYRDGDLWADPGATCGRTAQDSCTGGINLVEWDGTRISEVLRVPTSPVRRIRCLVSVSPETADDELVERLQSAVLEHEPAMGEELWLIDWQIDGCGAAFEKLRSASALRDLEEAVESGTGNGSRLQRVHCWNLHERGTNAPDDVVRRLQDWLADHAQSVCAGMANEFGIRVPHAIAREQAERLLAEWLTTSKG